MKWMVRGIRAMSDLNSTHATGHAWQIESMWMYGSEYVDIRRFIQRPCLSFAAHRMDN